MNRFLVLSIAFLLLTRASTSRDDCQLEKGLFDRRSALITSGGAGSNAPELQRINEEYFQFLLRVSKSDFSKEAELGCCKSPGKDPVERIVCKFVRYLKTGKKDYRLLLESVPTDATSREALWALEPIAYLHAEREPNSAPAIFKPSGPVTLFLDELFNLVSSGDSEAISKYLELYLYSDGEHAEEMDDQIESLFHKHLSLVLKHWTTFRIHRDALLKFAAFLSNEEKRTLRAEIAGSKECARASDACSEIKSLLSAQTPLRK